MRLVLGLDTATSECAVGLASWPDGPATESLLLGESNVSVPRAALTHIVPMIMRLLSECGREIDDVDAVVVGRGPGSFTGVRIGIATAKGIAQGLGVPLYGAGTLEAVAERFAGRDGLIGIVGDAMRGEVYPALFRGSYGEISRLTPEEVCRPEEAASRWALEIREPVLIAGDGLAKYLGVFTSALGERAEVAVESLWTPSGASLLAAAWRSGIGATTGDPAVVLPIYTRLSDAEENEAVRAGKKARLTPTGVGGPASGGEQG